MTADTGNVNTQEMLTLAGLGLPTLNDFDPDYKDNFQRLQDQLSEPAWYEDVETDLETRAMIAQCPVSDSVRQACETEMRNAEKCGWRIID